MEFQGCARGVSRAGPVQVWLRFRPADFSGSTGECAATGGWDRPAIDVLLVSRRQDGTLQTLGHRTDSLLSLRGSRRRSWPERTTRSQKWPRCSGPRVTRSNSLQCHSRSNTRGRPRLSHSSSKWALLCVPRFAGRSTPLEEPGWPRPDVEFLETLIARRSVATLHGTASAAPRRKRMGCQR